ncbi:hypothetical protein [Thalassotalea maritima]|uniref:hypothetical protein n=1 Tax=Thalassotalea maritima TaxID=3242416 RepID=UPI0035271E67
MTTFSTSKIEKDVFRIMRHKLKGKSSAVELKCWQMVTIAKAIHERFGVYPYSIKLKHLIWYMEERLLWIRSAHTSYRYYLAIKGFCECTGKWPHWQNQLNIRKPEI